LQVPVTNGNVSHYHRRNDLEYDVIIHLRNSQYGFVEIKLCSDKAIAEGVETLNKLSVKIDNIMKHPAFKMILTGLGNIAYTLKEGIHIVPVEFLKN